MREILTAMTIDIRLKLLAVTVVGILFISGLGISQGQRQIAQASPPPDFSALNYEVGVHDKLLDRYGQQIADIDQRTIRLESAVEGIRSQIGVFNWIFGMCLIAILGALGETIYRRVILSRGEKT